MRSNLIRIAATLATASLAAGIAVAAPQTRTPTAREVVERQLAKKSSPPRSGLSAEEAAAIRARYLKSIGEQVQPAAEAQGNSGGQPR